MHIQRIADHQRTAFVTAQNAGRKSPCHLQLVNVALVDLVQLAVAREGEISRLRRPVVRISFQFREIRIRDRGTRQCYSGRSD